MKILFFCLPILICFLFWFWLYRSDQKKEPLYILSFTFGLGIVFFFIERLIFRGAIIKIIFSNDLFEFLYRYRDNLFHDLTNSPQKLIQSRIAFSVLGISAILEGLRFFGTDLVTKVYRKYLIDDSRQFVDHILYCFTFSMGFGLLDIYSSIEINADFLGAEKLYLILGILIHLFSSIILGLGFYLLRGKINSTFLDNKPKVNKFLILIPLFICWMQHAFIKWAFWQQSWFGIIVAVLILGFLIYYWYKFADNHSKSTLFHE